MRKIILKSLVFIFLLGTVTNLFSQNFYFSLNAGYGLKLNGLTYYEEVRQAKSNSNYTSTRDVNRISFGKGFNVTGALGYMFNKNMGVELGLSYLIGGTTSVKDSYYDVAGALSYSNTDYSARMFRINPSVYFTAGNKMISPYARFGLIIGFATITEDYEDKISNTIYNPNPPYGLITNVTATTHTEKMNGSMALGFNAALGAALNVSDKFCWFAELNVVSLSYAPTKGEIVSYTLNGQNNLSNLNTSQRETEYSENYSYDTSVGQPFNEPGKSIRVNHPFSSIGINLGFRAKL
ncbi:MAG: outer membrane beta-barrel protein [Bacteroidetes bacterium]|nr:outer membrane beta-barrel protein [Bacteroidota bacterium]